MRGEVPGVERRRRWDDDVKLAIVSAVGIDGATVTQVAQRHGVTRQQIYAWRNELKRKGLVVIAREDDTAFGILHSRLHELWTLALGGWHGVGNDPQYTPSLGFETFPFPEGLTPDIPAADYTDDPRAQAIATAAARLNELRDNWLNPSDLVDRLPEVVPGYPDRLLPKTTGPRRN